MRKLILLLIFTVAIIAPCFSIPQFILDKQVTLTPEQNAEFKQKNGERPDDLSFNPLQVGNKWWRRLNSGSFQIMREVVDSILINNHTYYKVVGLVGTGDFWIRNEGDSTLVYDHLDVDNNPATTELVCEDFSFTGQALVYHDMDSFSYPTILPWYCGYSGGGILPTWGMQVEYRFHDYYYPEQYNSLTYISWVRGLGLLSWFNDAIGGVDIGIAACRINGIYYGQTVSSSDETLTSVSKIEISCYPNPFNPSTTISYSLPKEMQISLDVYNLKGQKVKALQSGKQKAGQQSVVWHGTDEQNKKVSSGMYFYKLTTPDKTLTNKMVMMK